MRFRRLFVLTSAVLLLLGVHGLLVASGQGTDTVLDAGVMTSDAGVSDASPSADSVPLDQPDAAIVANETRRSFERPAPVAVTGKRGYFEPSTFLVFPFASPLNRAWQPHVLGRASAGIKWSRYKAGGRPGIHVRFGVTAYGTYMRVGRPDGFDRLHGIGVGLELGTDWEVTRCLRVGGRLGAETARDGSGLFTGGVRGYYAKTLSFGADVYGFSNTDASGKGLMLELGLTGDKSPYLTIPVLVTLLLVGNAVR